MTLRAIPQNGNVTAFRPRGKEAPPQPRSDQAEAARYVAQMTLELERLANTAGLELVSYFLAMARSEADHVATSAPSAPAAEDAEEDQAPYRAE